MTPSPELRLFTLTPLVLFRLVALICTGCILHAAATPQTAVSIQGAKWLINGKVVLAGSPAEGLLMNVRMVNTVLEDLGPNAKEHLPSFSPDENTDRFIATIPRYYALGVRAFTVSLQGGHTGYEQVLNSAFNADGSLRPDYMKRVSRVVEACDRLGVVVILTAFYQRQHWHDRALTGREAILAAVGNMARWVDGQGYTNVLLEISNEYAHGGFRKWQDGEWMRSPQGQVEMIRHAKAAVPRLLVSTSDGGHGRIHESIANTADYVLLHFNNTALEDIPERIRTARAHGKPVLCNEDDKVGSVGAEALRLSVQHGAGWGMMHSKKNQYAPFSFDGRDDDPVTYDLMRRLTTPGESLTTSMSDETFVIITQPNDGAVLSAGGNVGIRASVSGGQTDTIREVQFFAGERRLGSSTAAPWSVRWDNVPAGAHNLTAVAIDKEGKVIVRSRPVDIQVTPVSR